MENKYIKRNFTLPCFYCNKPFLKTVKSIFYNEMLTADKIESVDGPNLKNGDLIRCHFCLSEQPNNYALTIENWKS